MNDSLATEISRDENFSFSGRTNSNNEAEDIAEEHASAHDVCERL